MLIIFTKYTLNIPIICIKLLFLQNSFRFTRLKREEFPHIPPVSHMHSFPIVNITHQKGTLVTIDVPTLTHHNHPKSTGYIKVYSWCCTFHGFGPMYHDIYSPLQFYSEQFHSLKILCDSSIHPVPSRSSGNHWYFYYHHSFAFS